MDKLAVLADPKDAAMKTTEELKAFLAPIVGHVNTLIARAEAEQTAVSRDDLAKVEADLKGLAAEISTFKPQVEAVIRTGPPKGGDVEGLGDIRLAMEAPKGVNQLFYNLVALPPEELSYAASVMAASGPRKVLDRCAGMSDFWQRKLAELKARQDFILIADTLMAATNEEYASIGGSRQRRIQTLHAWKPYVKLVEEFKAAAGTALDTQTADQGLEWIPTMFSSALHDIIQPRLVVSSLFSTITMPAPTYVSPVMGADMIAYLASETLEATGGTKVTSNTFTTKKMTLTAKKLGARILTSNEFVEDSLVPVIPLILQQIGKSLARARDNATLNGDTTAPHMDNDVTAADDARKIWKGVRWYAKNGPADARVDGSAGDLLIRDHLMEVRKGMKQYGLPGAGVVYIVGYSGLVELLLAKDDAGNNVLLTVDKYGPGAVIRNGEVGSIMGVPVVLSEFLREDVDATGVHSAGPNTFAQIIAVNTEAFTFGERRVVTIQRLNELYAETDQIAFVGFWRGDFQPWYATGSTGEPVVGELYNVRV